MRGTVLELFGEGFGRVKHLEKGFYGPGNAWYRRSNGGDVPTALTDTPITDLSQIMIAEKINHVVVPAFRLTCWRRVPA